ncbi:hypothetical protein [Methanoculleus virus Blf4]|uniref:Uncharacterized protein n=1 Tax=Methanoculleus virus Blf4 TaxID=3070925 RepID=A0AA48X6C3_9CAUD|nr:hypothetical protein QIT39_gp47 [Methanoculleus virus L4768]QXM18664.1 hypothetical protein [Methanoculleus virus Blf4]
MASKTIARTLQIHGDFIKEIYGAVGDQPFAARRLATLGVDIPPGVCLSRFRNAGIFTLVGRGASQKAIWRLSPDVLEYCATREVTA